MNPITKKMVAICAFCVLIPLSMYTILGVLVGFALYFLYIRNSNESNGISVDDNKINLNKRSVNAIEKIEDKKYIFKDGESNLNNDAYQLYLVKKYSISKNQVLSKFVLGNKLYENIEDVLNAAKILDSSINKEKKNSELSEMSPKNFNQKTDLDSDIDNAFNYLILNKFSVIKKTHYRVPRLQYIISKDDVTKIIYSDMEFLNFVEKLKQTQVN